MPSKSVVYYKKLLQNPSLAKEIKGEGEYIVCTIKYKANGQAYHFLSKDESIRTGDKIYIDTTYQDFIKVIVVEVRRYTKE